MKTIFTLALALQGVAAFPSLDSTIIADRDVTTNPRKGCATSKRCDTVMHISDADINFDPKNLTPAQKHSKARTNCGEQGPCKTFKKDKQFVSQSGTHRYIKPKRDEIRGPCPGLNAAANHNYLPRSGVPSILQTINGLRDMYNMRIDLAGFLAAYAVVLDGDVVSGAWSIGGPPKDRLNLLGPARGISYSHNKYEGDTSIGRCDAYVNGGDAHSLSVQRFKYAYESGMDDDRYTLDKFSINFAKNTHRSVRQNPYYFAPLFSTTLVSPAAYNFVINFMSNHTAEEPSGYLNGAMFKKFFGIVGEYPNFKWAPGQERMPYNWYKRSGGNKYNALSVFQDLIPEFRAYPDAFRFGGNTNGVDSYAGISLGQFSGGTITRGNVLEGNNLACLVYQNLQQAVPDILKPIAGSAGLLSIFNKHLDNAFGSLTCPKIAKMDEQVYSQFPGNAYSPTGPGLNC